MTDRRRWFSAVQCFALAMVGLSLTVRRPQPTMDRATMARSTRTCAWRAETASAAPARETLQLSRRLPLSLGATHSLMRPISSPGQFATAVATIE